jgi:2-hydroxy-3-keto-5-methylthiopentenyl-1-phosphate phosphatase
LASLEKTILFIDFDNTITLGDVLDSVIETFSRTKQWIEWEREWLENRMSSIDCLTLQVGNLEVDQESLLQFVRLVEIDPSFVEIQSWAAATQTDLVIVSDNFEVILREILRKHAIVAPAIFANALAFEHKRLVPSFPHRSPTCARCAHCKASHFGRYAGYHTIYVGDGLSDICPAMRAERVFAKDSLAAYLTVQGVPFTRFENLGDVVGWLSREKCGRVGAVQLADPI